MTFTPLRLFSQEKSQSIRAQFPILEQSVNNEPLIYFDNAATSQTPHSVVEALADYYHYDNANIHRGVHTLAERATRAYEGSRHYIANFIGAKDASEVIFTSGTTDGINFLARGLVEDQLETDDIILTTPLEHHSNLVPWQELCQRKGAKLEYMALNEDFQVNLSVLKKRNTENIRAIVIQHVSNVLGVEQPIQTLSEWAREHDILLIVDGAQAIPHQAINVNDLGIDAYCFSGHKAYGPTGVGICYLNERHHQQARPVQYGGEMIHFVGDYESNYKDSPWKFEAGTPPIAQAIALQAALEYINQTGIEAIAQHEAALTQQLYQGLQEIDGIELYQSPDIIARNPHGIISFNFTTIHPHDAASAYDMEGIAVRAGHHCAQVLMRKLDVAATLRASVGMYNTAAEVEQFLLVTKKIKEFFDYVSI
ncbi:cysteine desulfurase [Ruoffia tabacinasalis]|uniref:Cysteine desulfurase n=1 Tax=Ruoffia tabacinasalis TaxID=87458 RepID=A0A5R9DWI7_9LACT|nr:cysteine desulfurase [Ruoffia tabacinasalis]TLQ40699.1 cysteine desulfurase [Ruoffia tabacinasalis]